MYEIFWSYLNKLVGPLSANEDARRREFILNVILIGSLSLALVATLHILVDKIQMGSTYGGSQPGLTFVFFLLFLALYFASRAKFAKEASYILTGVYFAGATYTAYLWGSDVPQALLVYAVVIVIAGILVSTRFAFLVTLAVLVSLVVIAWLQSTGIISVDRYWVNLETPDMADAITASVTLVVIALVSWLSNREIEKSLFRARRSETALKDERDHLEETVEKRTKELRRTQLEKMLQMYRFAEFGKLASGLFHDFVNPLTTVSLNLEEIDNRGQRTVSKEADIKTSVQRAISGIQQMERFVETAQRQIKQQSEQRTFSVGDEIEQTLEMLEYKATDTNVSVAFDQRANVELYGDPIKLNQLVMNLVSNAIDSYGEPNYTVVQRRVLVTLSQDLASSAPLGHGPKTAVVARRRAENSVLISVQDWGDGIAPENLKKIFEPLFTTKQSGKGTGLGLAICTDILKKEFQGEIHVTSTLHQGTTFIVSLPLKSESVARRERKKLI